MIVRGQDVRPLGQAQASTLSYSRVLGWSPSGLEAFEIGRPLPSPTTCQDFALC